MDGHGARPEYGKFVPKEPLQAWHNDQESDGDNHDRPSRVSDASHGSNHPRGTSSVASYGRTSRPPRPSKSSRPSRPSRRGYDSNYVRSSIILLKKEGPAKTSKRAQFINQACLVRLQEKHTRRHIRPIIYKTCELIVENKYVTIFMATITVWALIGDDIRVLTTEKSADNVFNVIVLFMIFLFSVELVMSCLGKKDYFLGFFFWLDAISTASLVLDLTWVADALFNEGSSSDTDKARSGRTARIGARLGRIVRVLRLIRIMKLYKAYYESRRKKTEEAKKQKLREQADRGDEEFATAPGDDWDEADDATPKMMDDINKETLVGKQLSERTTRSVIIMILAMLIVIPLLQADSYLVSAQSSGYGADGVQRAFNRYLSQLSDQDLRGSYDRELLRYVYYHNWFADDCDEGCPALWYSQVFWVGISAGHSSTLDVYVPHAPVSSREVSMWSNFINTENNQHMYVYGSMPSGVTDALQSPWTTNCTYYGKSLRGISLLEAGGQSTVVKCPNDLRPTERILTLPENLTPHESELWHFAFFFDMRPYNRAQALSGILSTLCICILLSVASMMFSLDANQLVLNPLEKMISKVEKIRDDPSSAKDMADDEFKVEEMQRYQEHKKNDSANSTCSERVWNVLTIMYNLCVICISCRSADGQKTQPMETVILEKTIIKLGSMLALGFGEAGANIVSANMKSYDSAGVNAMIPGSRVECIIGDVRVMDFSTVTEVLLGKVMTFVNQIAEIVHGIVSECHGASNKNNGDDFILVWNIDTEKCPKERARRLADLALLSMARILGAIHRSRILAQYREHPGLQQRLGSKCRVNVSIGLHSGWAIEGAVGSEFKIDASYLSPNVSIAQSVEQAAQLYKVCLLITQQTVDLLSKSIACKLRKIDKVTITGSAAPIELYTLDLDVLCLDVDHREAPVRWNARVRFQARQKFEVHKSKHMSDTVDTNALFNQYEEIVAMRKCFTREFTHTFNMGYQNYSQGEWPVARTYLNRCVTMLRSEPQILCSIKPNSRTSPVNREYVKDGPSEALLRFMASFDFQAPKKWEGHHPLDSR